MLLVGPLAPRDKTARHTVVRAMSGILNTRHRSRFRMHREAVGMLARAGVALLLAACSRLETQHRHFDRRAEWSAAPPLVSPSATDIDVARDLDVECRQWVRFTFAPGDSSYLATHGDSTIASSAVVSTATPPTWWAPPIDRDEATARAISDAGWTGMMLVMWSSRRAYFVGC